MKKPPVKEDVTERGVTKLVGWGIMLILVAIPFHALISTWPAAHFGHFDWFRIWKELLLAIVCLGAAGLLLKRPRIAAEMARSWLVRLMLAYFVVTALMTIFGVGMGNATHSAAAYGFIVNARLPVFFLVVTIYLKAGGSLRNWRRLVFIPAAAVIIFGLMQYALPANFLTHFGYGDHTIPAFQTVDNKLGFVRLQSTLRGPNPFGAYLVLVLCLALAASLRSRKRWQYMGLYLAGAAALYGTYSRSAWLAAVGSLGLILLLSIKNKQRQWTLLAVAVIAMIIVSAGVLVLRNNDTIENLFFHTSSLSTSPQSSNQRRATALKDGVKDIVHEPLGRGVGTAGPASARNGVHGVRIAENYFLQIGQEAGWLGLGLFAAITIILAMELYKRRSDPLALGLFAALIGLTFINMLSHAWTDDTIAYLFWGLAAIPLAAPLKAVKSSALPKRKR